MSDGFDWKAYFERRVARRDAEKTEQSEPQTPPVSPYLGSIPTRRAYREGQRQDYLETQYEMTEREEAEIRNSQGEPVSFWEARRQRVAKEWEEWQRERDAVRRAQEEREARRREREAEDRLRESDPKAWERRENESRRERQQRVADEWAARLWQQEQERRKANPPEEKPAEESPSQLRYKREVAEAAEARRGQPRVNWRDAVRIAKSAHQPKVKREDEERWRVEKLRCDMELACDCLFAWEKTYSSCPACPLVVDWRDRAVAKFNEWSRQESSRPENRKYYNAEGRASINASLFRFSRRPTLSEYDNRRDGIVRDRYHFGIYNGKYDS